MLNPLNFFSKFIKSSNQKELDRIAKIVEKVNSFENEIKKIPDIDFPKKTLELKQRLKHGQNINELLPEAFALVREASARTRNERHYDVQIIGGVVLHEGKNRQVRKMFGRLGYSITGLKRIQMAKLTIGTLPPGRWRFVKKENIV